MQVSKKSKQKRGRVVFFFEWRWRRTWTKPIEGGPKSLKAGLKLDDDGSDGEGTEDPVWRRATQTVFIKLCHHLWEGTSFSNPNKITFNYENITVANWNHIQAVLYLAVYGWSQKEQER